MKPHGSDARSAAEDEEKGVLTLLQEYVQTSPSYSERIGITLCLHRLRCLPSHGRGFRIPQGMPALQWGYDVKFTKTRKSRFRARVAFLLDGIPHHAIGTWDSSKKNAQRQLADVCLKFFIGAWSSHLLSQPILEAGHGSRAFQFRADAILSYSDC